MENNESNMINTKELIEQPSTQKTISLSAVPPESKININATNGLTGVEMPVNDHVIDHPTISGNPYRSKSKDGKIRDISSLKMIDPSTRIKPAEQPKTETIQDRAIGLLAQAVDRKQKEYQAFVENAIEADKINRERVENGLEEVSDELQYMPDNLHTPITEEEKVTPIEDDRPISVVETIDDDIENDYDSDEMAAVDEETTEEFIESMPNIVFDNPFASVDEEEIEENIAEEEHIEQSTTIIDVAPEDIKEIPTEEVKVEESKPVETVQEEVVSKEKDKPNIEESASTTEEEPSDEFKIESINVTSSVLDRPIEASDADMDIDEEDLDDTPEESSNEDDEENISSEEIVRLNEAGEKNLRTEILHKIIQNGKKMDTKQFVVSTKVINLKDAMKSRNESKPLERTAIWPLMYAGRPYKASTLRGSEIAMLADMDNSENNLIGLSIDQIRILFEHDANPYRPKTLESWAKTIPFSDVENIFAALYMASLHGSNYMPMACNKLSCQHAYLSEDIPMDRIAKFETDEAKEKFDKIKAMELTPENSGSYESVVSVINEKFAVGLKIPSVYTILFEYAALNKEFIKKYSAIINIIQYIDYIYYIDEENSQFQPVGWKTYVGDRNKSFKSKVATYAKILKEFDDTEFMVLMSLINSMVNKMMDSRAISYIIPEEKCPKCGSVIESRNIGARGLVFMRQRLVELATTHLKK